ncbi:MAG: phosphate acyltransferase [Candidatus Omnitrophica bacterium CG11_big_fil_rev_8_21_14_0_20_45_26]|uniref:Phosphate acyltransferase n=1 Tax=Candidatus Abzuiibacterium crystallinum TaxID=1974748 RepID=A0A2H0LS92_9BACT|nr:MAG: phosphate acyltransferase [Candidatus Omnitrophica bacterium CG11_big_fil_rev_8_21_14_0_20_45_26]PIW65041.1 MAG: phosphate acyltransferase [Candidatus Omnitrophica bacterium CG12_big_fil_rev_8_21_14_0_65_45_16]
MIKVAVDGMGGDYAPQTIVDGAVEAALAYTDIDEIVIVGREDAIKRELKKHKVQGGQISIHHASEVIDMGDSPVKAIKKKKDSSLAVCIDLLKRKEVDAVISAGNTGAVVAGATLNLGLLPGVTRPGIAITFPTLHGISLALDVGANIDPSAHHLVQYAIMGEAYSRFLLKKKKPAVALLNIGEEESKGTEVLQDAYRMLRDSGINFIGNIEGRDFFGGKADCIVCDGFVGNVVLKMIESIIEVFVSLVSNEIKKDFLAKIGAFFCQNAFESIRRQTNYEEAGGAPLLGVDGVVIIGHGISSARAIRNAIRTGANMVENQVNNHIIEELKIREQNHHTGSANPTQKPTA